MAATLSEIVAEQEANNQQMRLQLEEALLKLNRMFSYDFVQQFNEDTGPDLQQLKEASKRIRESTALDGILKNGLKVRTAYIWRGGIHYSGIPGKSQGRGVNVQARIDKPVNQRNFFSQAAREKREAALYSDSQPFIVGDSKDWSLHAIPISQITGDLRNPEYDDEIWAYRREYTDYSAEAKGQSKVEWIFAETFKDQRKGRSTLKYKGQTEPIATSKVMFGEPVNGNTGWAYGTSDALAAIRYAGEYDGAMNAGLDVTEGLARIIGSIKKNSETGANDVAVKVGQNGAFGNLSAVGLNNDITMFQTAGNAYDFNKLLPVLARFAAALGVSVIELSANPGNAGGSYGAARSMTPMTEAMTAARRAYHVALDRQVLIWLGAKAETLDVWFDPIMTLESRYRGEQLIELRMGTGLYDGIEIKRMHAVLDGRNPDLVTAPPKGWMLPNNENSINRRDVDPNLNGQPGGDNPANGGGFAPTQGSGARTNPSGSADQNANDLRSREQKFADILAEFTEDERQAKLDRIIELLENDE